MLRKVEVELKVKVLMVVNEGVQISNVVDEFDYQITDTTTEADILDTEIIDYEVKDSK